MLDGADPAPVLLHEPPSGRAAADVCGCERRRRASARRRSATELRRLRRRRCPCGSMSNTARLASPRPYRRRPRVAVGAGPRAAPVVRAGGSRVRLGRRDGQHTVPVAPVRTTAARRRSASRRASPSVEPGRPRRATARADGTRAAVQPVVPAWPADRSSTGCRLSTDRPARAPPGGIVARRAGGAAMRAKDALGAYGEEVAAQRLVAAGCRCSTATGAARRRDRHRRARRRRAGGVRGQDPVGRRRSGTRSRRSPRARRPGCGGWRRAGSTEQQVAPAGRADRRGRRAAAGRAARPTSSTCGGWPECRWPGPGPWRWSVSTATWSRSRPTSATGLPSFSLVGLPDASLTESRDRVRAAIVNSDAALAGHGG